ncbi:MAG: L,D-transpeptidase family protein [Rhizobiales bacterium]|nr:L,D-transpeptidase family protein [Hyphomicrobiales bacterium]
MKPLKYSHSVWSSSAPRERLAVVVAAVLALGTVTIASAPAEAAKKRTGTTSASAPVKLALAPLPNRVSRPEANERDPVLVVISISEQRLAVYRGGVQIATSRVSTGRKGFATPTGIFSILQKRPQHYSNIYRGASMPFMQRVTWSGVAMHAGNLPGYPASHGCIRLPYAFSKQLFGMTSMNGHVVITRQGLASVKPHNLTGVEVFNPSSLEAIASNDQPGESTSGEVVLTSAQGVASTDIAKATGETPEAGMASFGDIEMMFDRADRLESYSDKPLRILVTRRGITNRNSEVQEMLTEAGFDTGGIDGALGKKSVAAIKDFETAHAMPVTGTVSDQLVAKLREVTRRPAPANAHIIVRQGYKNILDVPVTIKDWDKPLGTHLYLSMHFSSGQQSARWTALSTDPTTDFGSRTASSPAEALDRIDMPEFVRNFIADRMHPGSSLIIADNGHSYDTSKFTDFIVRTR